jgi:hypothetical protein
MDMEWLLAIMVAIQVMDTKLKQLAAIEVMVML